MTMDRLKTSFQLFANSLTRLLTDFDNRLSDVTMKYYKDIESDSIDLSDKKVLLCVSLPPESSHITVTGVSKTGISEFLIDTQAVYVTMSIEGQSFNILGDPIALVRIYPRDDSDKFVVVTTNATVP